MIFGNYPWLILLCILPFLYRKGRKREARYAVFYPQVTASSSRRRSWRLNLFVLSLFFLILALARPQLLKRETIRQSEGIDIMLTIDTSLSMKEVDYRWEDQWYSRLGVVKAVVSDFIDKRVDDRIGLVIFGSSAFAQAPLTLDHKVLKTFLDIIKPGMAGEETAIGDGLGVAVSRIKDRKAKSRIVILLTDGENNSGKLDPYSVAAAAKELGVKVHTISVSPGGQKGVQIFGFSVGRVPEAPDSELLKHIAEATGGKYFRAKDTQALIDVYEEINQLEKNRVEDKVYRHVEEVFLWFLVPGLILLFIHLALASSKHRVFV